MNQENDKKSTEDEILPLSKTKRKKQMLELQDLGKELVALSKDALTKVPMSDDLRFSIKEYKRLTSHEARRRQLQYIGRVMRNEDIEPMQMQLDVINGVTGQATAVLHRIERLRVQMIEKDEAIKKFLDDYPHADAQTLRTLVRNTRRETELNKPPKSFRALFQFVKMTLDHTQPSDLDDMDDYPDGEPDDQGEYDGYDE